MREKVREGATIKVRRDVFERLRRIKYKALASLPASLTYADLIEAFMEELGEDGAVKAVRKWLEKRASKRP